MGKDAGNRFKKQYNNYNPYNKLDLNRFHQVKESQRPHQGHQLHKKKRDLQRMMKHLEKQGKEVDQNKLEELKTVEQQLGERKKDFEQQKRKEFFIGQKYKQIMNIEKRKVAKKLRQIKEEVPFNKQLYSEWLRKLNYIKHFPQNLKYISLFPNGELAERALEFQKKIMDDIQKDLTKKNEKLNKFDAEYKPQQKKGLARKDDFFLDAEEQEPEQIEAQIEQEEEESQEQ